MTKITSVFAASLLALGLYAAPAHALNTRSFISVNGIDINPCTRTAPCRTLQEAHDSTNPGGEINMLVGGVADDGVGATSLFTRRGGHWMEDKKLIGTGAVGKSVPTVALSADGSVVMVGGSNDNGGVGAAWAFTRSGDGSPITKKRPTPCGAFLCSSSW